MDSVQFSHVCCCSTTPTTMSSQPNHSFPLDASSSDLPRRSCPASNLSSSNLLFAQSHADSVHILPQSRAVLSINRREPSPAKARRLVRVSKVYASTIAKGATQRHKAGKEAKLDHINTNTQQQQKEHDPHPQSRHQKFHFPCSCMRRETYLWLYCDGWCVFRACPRTARPGYHPERAVFQTGKDCRERDDEPL
jgi:hypothetical protein